MSRTFARIATTAALSGAMLFGSASAVLADSSIGTNISTSAGGTITSSGLLTASLGVTSTGAAVNLNASSNFAVNLATGTSTGAVSIGGGSGTVAIDSTSWDVSTAGVVSGLTGLTSTGIVTLSGAEIAGASPLVLEGATANAFETTLALVDPTADNTITFPDASGTVLLSGGAGAFTTLSSTGVTTIGNNSATVAIDSSDWDISATGAMTNIGAITMDGLLTGTAGATLSGAAISLNTSSNFAVNVATGTSTGAVSIGGGSNTVAVDSTSWDVSTAGAFTGVASIDTIGVSATALSFAGAGSVTSDTTNSLTLDSGSTGSILIGTGVAAKTITIGNGNDDTFSLLSSGLDVSTAGAVSGVTTLAMNSHLTLGPATSHIVSTQTTPPGVADGGTPTIATGSTDTAGRVTADAATAGGTLTLTFNVAYTNAPFCTISPANAATASTLLAFVATTTTTMVLADTDLSGGSWFYHCIGN